MSRNDFEKALAEWEKTHPVSDKDVSAPAGNKPKKAVPGPVEIDLHGMTKEESRKMLENVFLAGRMKPGQEIRVIHGVGRHSPDQRKVLKPFVREWLALNASKFEWIRPGRPGEGGPGVTVVRTKQS
jgi:DNA-nicking Smr family endonuclease